MNTPFRSFGGGEKKKKIKDSDGSSNSSSDDNLVVGKVIGCIDFGALPKPHQSHQLHRSQETTLQELRKSYTY